MTRRLPGPAIVYVTLQRTAEEVASFLADRGFLAEAYHAGLGDDVRHAVQERFMASAGRIVVATIAFGMGIDKADIRTVLHYNLPKGPESYAQEIGRAGRDGHLARCELFACPEDLITLENFAFGDTPTPEALASLVDDVTGQGADFDLSTYDLSQAHDVRPLVVQTLLAYLELEGILEATGPFYAEYKFKSDRPLDEVVDGFNPRRRDFLAGVFSHASRGRIWWTLDVQAVARSTGEPRSRIVAALGYLEEQGILTVQAAGARLGHRLLKPSFDREALLTDLNERFLGREARDIARVRSMLEFAGEQDCLTSRLTSYFGEELSGPCGHCGPCLGQVSEPLRETPRRTFTSQDRAIVKGLKSEGHNALATSRQLARFLCGIASPASTRARLSRDPRFATLAGFPFSRVLRLVGAAYSPEIR
jgi:ATP-dependent DNA helicase RecQ